MEANEFQQLVTQLANLPAETEWLEIKLNNAEPEEVGRNLSALSNSAALLSKPQAYIVWGLKDNTHNIVGTTFRPHQTKIGNEELENWLLRLLDPRIDFRIHEHDIDGNSVVLFEIPPAFNQPGYFKNTAYVRVGSCTQNLHNYREKERALWRIFDRLPFERGLARRNASSDDILRLIDYTKCFAMLGQPLPDNRPAILERLTSEQIIVSNASGSYDITNVGAILFAQNLADFDRLSRKALRVVIYKGTNRVETVKEQIGGEGYAIGFEGAIRYINDQLPRNEQIDQALRREVRMYPEIAVRELVANALIHQDFSTTGSGPMVEIFTDRMEISNPGIPLIDTLRFIDEPPRSRNEILAGVMRRLNICEERGSGIDKVIFHIEVYQLPAPDFRVAEASTVAVLYGARTFAQMNRDERIRACYQHACLQSVSGNAMSNASLRKRLGIEDKNYPMASRIIKDAIFAKLITPRGGGTGSKRDASYVPFWA